MVKKGNKPFIIIILSILLIAPVIWVIILKKGQHYSTKLPVLFERYADENGDTIYHTIEDFKLVNQAGDTVVLADYDGQILVVNFFFSTCPEVCPQMNRNVQNVYKEFIYDTMVTFLSFTVNPEYDNPQVLSEYAKSFGAELPKWHFLTGYKGVIYDLAEHSFRMPGSEDLEHEDFFHSDQVALIDKERRVRGIFEGRGVKSGGITNKQAVDRLRDAVRALKYEYTHGHNLVE